MALRPQTVCFTGHRDLGADGPLLSRRLDAALEKLYAMGYRRFLDGGARGFDLLAAQRVLALRDRHPDAQLVMVIPCANQTLRWLDADCRLYEHILCHADQTRVLSPDYYTGCMMVRNRYMVARASFCVCYLNRRKGGTMSTVAHASAEKVPILNLALEARFRAFVGE